MKKYFLFLGLLCGVSIRSHAMIVPVGNEEPITLRYTLSSVSASTNTILIDLSDTTNFPHKFTGGIDVGSIKVSASKTAISSGTIKVGVVTRTTPTSGDVKYFFNYDLSQEVTATSPSQIVQQNFFGRFRVNGTGGTPFFVSNDTTLTSSVYVSTVQFSNTANVFGTLAPGDIIMTYTPNGSSAMTIGIELQYLSEKP